MFKDQLECYQAIATELMEIIPEPWIAINIEAIKYDNIN